MKYYVTIYQPVEPTFAADDKKLEYKHKDFNRVYFAKRHAAENVNDQILLEDIFCEFNTQKPEDFKGHSLSVGDIVEIGRVDEIERTATTSPYICKNFGWSRIDWC